jgi:hypothetical protein
VASIQRELKVTEELTVETVSKEHLELMERQVPKVFLDWTDTTQTTERRVQRVIREKQELSAFIAKV